MKEIEPSLLLKYNDYVDLWADLVAEYYSKVLSNKIINRNIKDYPIFITNLSVLLMTYALEILKKFSKINFKIVQNIEIDLVIHYSKKIFPENEIDFRENWCDFFKKHSEFYSSLIKLNKNDQNDESPEIINFAKMLLNASNVHDKEVTASVQEISMILIESNNVFIRLSSNSGVSPKIFGKPDFVVKKS